MAKSVDRLLPAAILLIAGSLKIHFLLGDTAAPVAAILPTKFSLAISVLEILFAVWLFVTGDKIVDWLLCFVLFVVFACLSLTMFFLGQTSCGCFGVFEVHPLITFGLDCAALAYLFFVRPTFAPQPRSAIGIYRYVYPFALTVVGLALAVNLSAAAIGYANGDEVIAIVDGIDIGSGVSGEMSEVEIGFKNVSNECIEIIGAKSRFRDELTGRLPLKIDAGKTAILPVKVKFMGGTGKFSRRLIFYTSSQKNFTVVVRLDGVVVQ